VSALPIGADPGKKIEDGTSVVGETFARLSDGHVNGDVQFLFKRDAKSGLSALIVAYDGSWGDGNDPGLIGKTFDVARK
jgi:hypothetical protein